MSGFLALLIRLLLSLILYAFLGWALWSLWRDLQAGGRPAQYTTIPQLKLTLQLEDEEKQYQSSGGALTIGRDLSNNCSIPDSTVSAYHAQLNFHHNQWWLQDLESRNGTFLNQQPVYDPVVVTSGDQLQCGGIPMQLCIDRAE